MDILDKKLAITQAGDNTELAKELFQMLINELPSLNQAIATALTSNNGQAFWDAVHKLHGSTAYCGVPALRDATAELESAIKAEENEKYEGLVENIDKQITLLLENAKTFLTDTW